MSSDDIELSSPKIKAAFPETIVLKITNKKDLKGYWHSNVEGEGELRNLRSGNRE